MGGTAWCNAEESQVSRSVLTCDDEADVQLHDSLIMEEFGQGSAIGVGSADNGMGQTLRDGCLAHTRLP